MHQELKKKGRWERHSKPYQEHCIEPSASSLMEGECHQRRDDPDCDGGEGRATKNSIRAVLPISTRELFLSPASYEKCREEKDEESEGQVPLLLDRRIMILHLPDFQHDHKNQRCRSEI